jgi:purine catabolism regulator
LRPGQLVLSSAYPLQETNLEQLFVRFSRERVCAFGVKLGGFWREMPAELVGAANTAGLPLLELPPGRFEDLVNPILTAIAERQAERLRRSAVLHESLTAAALRDETPAAIARVVMHALGRPVAIFNARDELLTATGPRGLWTSPALVQGPLSAEDPANVEVEGTTFLVAPIVAAGRRYGTMCVAGVTASDSFTRSAVAQAAVVTATQLVGQQSIEALHRRFERELLDDLADGRVSPSEARKRARGVGWPLRRPYLVLLARRQTSGSLRLGAVTSPVIPDKEFLAFARALATAPAETRVFRRRAGLAIVLHLGERQPVYDAALEVAEWLAGAQAVSWAGSELGVGCSRTYKGITDFAAAFREAALSLSMAGNGGAQPLVTWFDDLGPARLLAAVDDREALARMASEILAPVHGADADGERDVLETLLVLLAHNMRLSDAADDLYFHYNTIRHRLSRLRDTLGDGLDGPVQRAPLALALSALRVLAVDDSAHVDSGKGRYAARNSKNSIAARP